MIFCVNINGIKAFGKHGANKDEKLTSQIFQIDIYYEYIVEDKKFNDNLDSIVDYRRIVDLTVSIVKTTSFNLIETLSLEITNRIRSIDQIIGASIKIRKVATNGYIPCDSLTVALREY